MQVVSLMDSTDRNAANALLQRLDVQGDLDGRAALRQVVENLCAAIEDGSQAARALTGQLKLLQEGRTELTDPAYIKNGVARIHKALHAIALLMQRCA